MATYVGFLRAINLGAKRKFPKDAIVRATEAAGFTDVATYINTGNVRFDTTLRSRARIEAALEEAYLAEAGFEVPTIVFTTKELKEIADREAASFGDERAALRVAAQGAAERGRRQGDGGGEHRQARSPGWAAGRCTCSTTGSSYGSDARLTNVQVEKLLGVATNRNLTVVSALAEKWC